MDVLKYMENPVYEIEDKERDVELKGFIADCVDVERIKSYCKECPRYCKVWSCPEHDFDPFLYWKLFSGLRIYFRKLILPEELTCLSLSKEEQAKIIDAIFFKERKHFNDQLRALETPESISLHVGHCDVCGKENCARRIGKPCRFPKKKRYSMESLGADVMIVSEKYFGEKLQWTTPDKLPEFFSLVGGILQMSVN